MTKKIALIVSVLLIATIFSSMAFCTPGDTEYLLVGENGSETSNHQTAEIVIGNITGGFRGVQVEITNVGDTDASNVDWQIAITGGLFDLINRTTEGDISTLKAGETRVVQSRTIFGLGDVIISVRVDGAMRNVDGLMFLFWVQVIPELAAELDIIASGFTSPVVLIYPPADTNRLFVADQIGKIFVIQDGEMLPDPFLDISDKVVPLQASYDERGLLGFAFHPDYEHNGRFFVYYSAEKIGEGINHESILSEFKVKEENPNQADPDSEKIIFRLDQPESNHNGGQLVFGPDDYLYLGLGDGGGAGDQHPPIGNGQNISSLLGSIIRIDVDSGDPYAIPPDNPFVGEEGRDEIYAYGFRNPWKFSFDGNTLIVADVGQDMWEELDNVEKSGNYGWRIMEGNHLYDPDLADQLGIDIDSLEKPFHEYSHSVGKTIIGGYVYRGTSEELSGKYVFGDWSSSFIKPSGKIFYLEEIEPGTWQRYQFRLSQPFNHYILGFGEDQNHELYVLTTQTLGPTGTTGDVRRIIVK
jgi:glucose/arabinose dehydrogenase